MSDFTNERSDIEMTMNSLGVEVVFAPKGHCGLAGRGIECTWGVTKTTFRKENATLSNDDRVNNLPARVRKTFEKISIKNNSNLFKTIKRV